MPILSSPGVLRRLLLPVLLLFAAPVALAQGPTDTPVTPVAQDNDPAELLARALRTLQAEPRNLGALTAAGHNALLLGDSNAAVGFFGRAQEIAPRDGRVKAGLGSALVQLEKPQDALRLFADASRLGVPDVEFAADRGLAYDLTGDPKRAQRDYALVLAVHPDDDTTRRRLALSQGISGDKSAALQTLDPLVRKKDIAAWRAQTFVLAMNGDTKGANDITRVMLPQQATMLQPFLARLAGLTPAAKARAVHFGEMPAAGQRYSPTELANIGTQPTYAPAPRSDLAPVTQGTQFAQAPTMSPPPPVLEPGMPSPAAAGHYDLPHVAADRAARTIGTPVIHDRTSGDEDTRSSRSKSSARNSSHADEDEDCVTVKVSSKASRGGRHHHKGKVATKTVCKAHKGKGGEDQARSRTKASGADESEDCTRVKTTTRGSRHHKGHATTKLVCKKSKDEDSATSVKGKHGKSTVDDADDEASTGSTSSAHGKDCKSVKVTSKATRHHKAKTTTKLVCKTTDDDDATPVKGKKGASKSKSKSAAADEVDDSSAKGRKTSAHGKSAKTAAKTADEGDDDSASKSSKATGTEKGAHYYVQVAGGARKADMDKAWAGVKKKAPELMKGKTPATTPLHATHRLMVGPFKDEDEAQAFVNKMSGKGLSGFVVKTNKGQKVEKIDAAP
ncbi:MAG TPA: SPOR domain-containing protein [Sphingomonas sp.]|nr:SPOR domain-containing protein [Sphingomonas sp.]